MPPSQIHPMLRRATSLALTPTPTPTTHNVRAIAARIGPSTLPTREFVTFIATLNRPCLITRATFVINLFHAADIRADVLISRDPLTDLDAQVRDTRISRQRGIRAGFVPTSRGPTYALADRYDNPPIYLKAYFYSPTIVGAYVDLTILIRML